MTRARWSAVALDEKNIGTPPSDQIAGSSATISGEFGRASMTFAGSGAGRRKQGGKTLREAAGQRQHLPPCQQAVALRQHRCVTVSGHEVQKS